MDKYYITMETEDSPLTTYELDIKNKQNVCEFKVKGGTFYICYTVVSLKVTISIVLKFL